VYKVLVGDEHSVTPRDLENKINEGKIRVVPLQDDSGMPMLNPEGRELFMLRYHTLVDLDGHEIVKTLENKVWRYTVHKGSGWTRALGPAPPQRPRRNSMRKSFMADELKHLSAISDADGVADDEDAEAAGVRGGAPTAAVPTAAVATAADVREIKEACAAQGRAVTAMSAQLAELTSQMATLAAAVHGERRGGGGAAKGTRTPRAAPTMATDAPTPSPANDTASLGAEQQPPQQQTPQQPQQQRAGRTATRAGPVAITC
jgi:hypothetical protein